MVIGSVLFLCFTWLAGWAVFYKVPFLFNQSKDLTEYPSLSIIIPARNEAENLPILLKTLEQQQFRPKEIIVSDDNSTDSTIEVAKSYGAQIIEKQPSDSSVGKGAACSRGAEAATGEWLLFMDADTYLESKDSLHHFMRTFERQGRKGVLSVQPYHQVKFLYEQISIIFNIMVLAGMNAFTFFGDRFVEAGAFGPCLMCTKEQYELVGGHKIIRGSIMEDFVLGKKFQESGFPIHLYAGKKVIHFRMYPDGIKQLIEGWSKNFATASQATNPKVLFLIICWISGGILSGVFLVATLFFSIGYTMFFGVAIYLFYLIQLKVFTDRVGQFRFSVLIGYPFLFFFFIVLFSWSMIQTHIFKTVTWKGRKLKV